MKRYCRKVPWETPHTHTRRRKRRSGVKPDWKPAAMMAPCKAQSRNQHSVTAAAWWHVVHRPPSGEEIHGTNEHHELVFFYMFRMSSTENWILCAIHFLCRRAIQRHISNSSGINYFSLSLSGINTCELLSLQDCAIPFVWHGPPSLKHRTGYHPPPSLSPSCWMGIKWGENNALQFYI